jgi:hypothetical protein
MKALLSAHWVPNPTKAVTSPAVAAASKMASLRRSLRDKARPVMARTSARKSGDSFFAKGVALVKFENVRPKPSPGDLHQEANSHCKRRRRRQTVDKPAPKIRYQQAQPEADAHNGGGLFREEAERDEETGERGAPPALAAQCEPQSQSFERKQQRVRANQIVEVTGESETGGNGPGAADACEGGKDSSPAIARLAHAGHNDQRERDGEGGDGNQATEQVAQRQDQRQQCQQRGIKWRVEEGNEIERRLDINSLPLRDPLRVQENATFHPFEIEWKCRPAGKKSGVPAQLHQRGQRRHDHRSDDKAGENGFPANLHA